MTHEVYGPAIEVVREHGRRLLGREPGPDDALFLTPPSNALPLRPLEYHSLWHHVEKVGEQAVKAGLIRASLEFTPHLFRRTYITQLYRAGMRLKALQAKSRHKSMGVLIDHYIDDSEPATPYLAKILDGVA